MPSVRVLRTPLPRLPDLSSSSAAVAWATPWLVWSAALVVAVLTGPDVSVGPGSPPFRRWRRSVTVGPGSSDSGCWPP